MTAVRYIPGGKPSTEHTDVWIRNGVCTAVVVVVFSHYKRSLFQSSVWLDILAYAEPPHPTPTHPGWELTERTHCPVQPKRNKKSALRRDLRNLHTTKLSFGKTLECSVLQAVAGGCCSARQHIIYCFVNSKSRKLFRWWCLVKFILQAAESDTGNQSTLCSIHPSELL